MTILPTLLLLTSLYGQLEESFQQDFGAELHPMVELVGSDAAKLAKRQGPGLLVHLGSDRAAGEEFAIGTKFRLHGDFEITLDYELVSVTKPHKGLGAGVKIWCQVGAGNEEPERITLGHLSGAEHDNAFVMIRALPKPDGNAQQTLKWFDAAGKSGKLRLARIGTKLQSQVAEGDSESFRQLHEIDVTDRDVSALRFVVSRHGSPTALSIKLRQADIRANHLLGQGETRVAKHEPNWIVLTAVSLLIGGGAIVGWRYRAPLRKVLFKGSHTETPA